jgi:hypothetical protein
MYSEERREAMQQQVSSLHTASHQQTLSSTTTSNSTLSKEAQEWQQLARKEKHHVEYAESSHFSMVRDQIFIYSLDQNLFLS